MKLSGKITMKPMPCIASGDRASIPSNTPAQVREQSEQDQGCEPGASDPRARIRTRRTIDDAQRR